MSSKIVGWLVGDWDGKFQILKKNERRRKNSEINLKKGNTTFLPKCQHSSSYGMGVMMFWRFGGKGWVSKWVTKVLVKQSRLQQTLSIWLGIQFRQRYSQIKDWMPNILFYIFLTWHDPEAQGVQELILDLFRVHSWLTYGWKSVQFWWYFHTCHENGD